MNEAEWRAERNSRTLRYAGRTLDPNQRILLRADSGYASRYDGQVAILTAANLLGRMTPAIALDIPSVPVVDSLPWAGVDLRSLALEQLFAADPFGMFVCRIARDDDYVLHFGRTGASTVVHGSGWNSYAGPPPSPLIDDESANPIGPAMAAIMASAEAFRYSLSRLPGFQLNALTWQSDVVDPMPILATPAPGVVWFVGVGSVGTAVLYFLSLATRHFTPRLFDMDDVRIHNLDRSPIFIDGHVGQKKVKAAGEYLSNIGIPTVDLDPIPLDEATAWRERPPGVPDLLISTANERNVRSVIENGYPPLQIYGTTGRHWQAAVIRHTPLEDPCSCCLFPDSHHATSACATGSVPKGSGDEKVDAALPFLSFAAGAMATAEILKLGFAGYPFTANRVILNTRPRIRAVHAALAARPGCLCGLRSEAIYRQMLCRPAGYRAPLR